MATTAPPTSSDLQAWLCARAGGRVTAWEQLTAGNSRTTWLATFEADDGDGARRVVVRSEAGDGPFSDTELTLRREATLYQALTGSGIRMPELVAFDTASGTFAMSGLAGKPVWNEDALDDLLAELARLHQLDPTALELPGFARSSLGDLELWAGVAQRRIAPQSPLVDFAIAFLRRHHPGEPQRLVLCHGDAGPGNFLHDGKQLTGLLDWEFAHIGDPLDDLAWITVRAILFGVELPDFARRAREIYAPAAGVELDEERLRYWQAVVILRNLITCLASTSNPVRGRDRLVHHMLVPSLQVMLVDALARVAGIELETVPPVTPAPTPLPALPVIADIAEDLTGVVDALQDPAWRTRAKRMRLLLTQLAETLPLAPAIAQADAATQVDAATNPQANGAAGGTPANEAARLQQLNGEVRRHLQLFPRAAPMASVPVQGF